MYVCFTGINHVIKITHAQFAYLIVASKVKTTLYFSEWGWVVEGGGHLIMMRAAN